MGNISFLRCIWGRKNIYIALSKISKKCFHLIELSRFFLARPSKAKTGASDVIPGDQQLGFDPISVTCINWVVEIFS